MKKTVIWVLCLLMVVFLVACGVQAIAEESGKSAESAFDTSWAGDEYVMPIPEPPFAYTVSVNGTAVEIRSTNGGKNGDVTHQSILEYCDALKNAGFTLKLSENEIGERYGRTCYEFSAKDAAGNHVELLDDGGAVMIFTNLAKVSDETHTEGNNSVDISALGIPELPEGNWEKEQVNDNTYVMTIEDIDYADIDKYLGTLFSEHFSIIDIEPYAGASCEIQAEKNVGSSGLKINIQYGYNGNDCRVSITKKQYQ